MEINSETCYLYQIAEVSPYKKSLINKNIKKYKLVNPDCVDCKMQKIVDNGEVTSEDIDDLIIANKGDIIISLKQNFKENELCVALVEEENMLVSQDFFIITPKEKENSEKILTLFRDEYVVSQIKPLYTGDEYFHINIQEIKNIQLPR